MKMGSCEQTSQFWENEKSHGARSGDYGACSRTGTCFVAKNWQILWDHFGAHFSTFSSVLIITGWPDRSFSTLPSENLASFKHTSSS